MDLYDFISTEFNRPIGMPKKPVMFDSPSDIIGFGSNETAKEEPAKEEIEQAALQKRITELEGIVSELQQERNNISTRLQSTEYDKASLESLISELKDRQSLLVGQIRAINKDKSSVLAPTDSLKTNMDAIQKEIETLSAEKTGLQENIRSLESSITALQQEKSELNSTLQRLQSEKDALIHQATQDIADRDSEKERLLSELSVYRTEASERLSQKELLMEENADLKRHLEDIKRDFATYKQNTMTVAFVAFFMAVAVVIVFLSSRATKVGTDKKTEPPAAVTQQKESNKPEDIKSPAPTESAKPEAAPRSSDTRSSNEAVPQKADAPASKAKAAPNVKDGTSSEQARQKPPFTINSQGLRVSLSPLRAEDISKLTASNVKDKGETGQLYMIKIQARHGMLSRSFIKSPVIDFINKDNVSALKDKKDSGIRIIQTRTSKSGKGGLVVIESIVSLRKDFQPSGVVIGPMNKTHLKITIL